MTTYLFKKLMFGVQILNINILLVKKYYIIVLNVENLKKLLFNDLYNWYIGIN